MSSNERAHQSVSLCQTTAGGSFRQDLSVEELLAARKNAWRDWLCSAGSDNVHISPDGEAFAASCRVGGSYGNVFSGTLELPQRWIRCTKSWCMCGADMQLRKARLKAFQARCGEPLPEREAEVASADWVAPTQEEAHRLFPKTITWDLSRRCNYSCSYCHPSVSNHTDAHWSRDKLFTARSNIEEKFCRGIASKWIFTGGEPTLNPSFFEMVESLHGAGHLVHVQSNGSMGPDYFSRLAKIACVGLSLHFEAFNRARFFETTAALLAAGAPLWCGVRIMVPPGRIVEALQIRDELLQLPGARERLSVNLSPLYQQLNQDQLQKYEASELALVQRYA